MTERINFFFFKDEKLERKCLYSVFEQCLTIIFKTLIFLLEKLLKMLLSQKKKIATN